jgi:hypothetical protein
VLGAALGQDAVPVKAGDRAPDIDWTRIVRSPASAKYQPNLSHQYLADLMNVGRSTLFQVWNRLMPFIDFPKGLQ